MQAAAKGGRVKQFERGLKARDYDVIGESVGFFKFSAKGSRAMFQKLKEYLDRQQIEHTRGKPYHPMTQGKIERYHRTMKNLIKLQNYWFPEELERNIEAFVQWYNNERVHESLNNVTPHDMYQGKQREILTRRENIKRKTLKERKRQNLKSRGKNNYTVKTQTTHNEYYEMF